MIWKFAAAWGELRQADKQNHLDINSLGRKVRKYDKLTWQRLDNMETFLQNRFDYNPPSINLFEEEEYEPPNSFLHISLYCDAIAA